VPVSARGDNDNVEENHKCGCLKMKVKVTRAQKKFFLAFWEEKRQW
jgi:hypothetical protein